jgi:HK97 family phage prohead protease
MEVVLMITKDREYRAFEFETSEMRVEGMPVVFEQSTVLAEIDGVKFYEVIDRNAFNETKMDDVVLNIDHSGKPAAKTKNGTLELRLSDDGLFISADLSKNATGRELYEDIQNKFFEKMSFAFTVREEEYDKKTRTRRIMKIDRLFDVSAVTFPAYNQTSIMARDSFAMELEKERLEERMRDEKKRRLLMKLQIEGGLE